MAVATDPAARYFDAISAALGGLDVFLRDDSSPLYKHDLVAKVMAEYIVRLENSFNAWRNRLGFMESFRISRAESGYPVYQNVLELENDRRTADKRIAAIPEAKVLRAEMADFILRHRAMPAALRHEQAMIGLVLDSADAHEGCKAFLEKRDAVFTGE